MAGWKGQGTRTGADSSLRQMSGRLGGLSSARCQLDAALLLCGASARSARAPRTYDRIMDNNP
jgi:hypothetical protein